jgi:quercetin dioxygenase-like cupin family protein
MTQAIPQSWSDVSQAAISEDAVRQLHKPEEKFKVYVNNYEPAQNVDIKASHAFTVYVVSGTCTLDISGKTLGLDAGQFIALDDGSYACVAGPKGVSLVKVFAKN